MKILIADDSRINQRLAQGILEGLGYKADLASTGVEVLNAIMETRYDFIFMDVQMPEMDGVEAAREIRDNIPAEIRPKVIAMTANNEDSEIRKCLEAGMIDSIGKPISRESVQAIINKWRNTGADEAAAQNEAVQGADDQELINPDTVQSLKMMGEDLFVEFITIYADEDAPPLVEKIEQHYASGEAEELGKAAHGLKGISANMGADVMAAVCKKLELKGKANDLDEVEPLIAEMKNIFTKTCAELKNQIA